MARTGLRVTRFAVVATIVVLIIFKLSTDKVDLSSFVASKSPVPVSPNEYANSERSRQAALVDKQPFSKAGEYDRENATFVTLARNADLWSLVGSIRQVEDRFNHKYHYDWVFLNDGDFDDNFKKITTAMTSGNAYYGKIPTEHWSYPEYIDQEKAAEARKDMQDRKIIYGGSESYRHMCRYESGFFWRHPLMNNYKYYWRVEPDIKLHCDIEYDLFKFMSQNGKKYGFTISLYEYIETIPTLWETTKKFLKDFPKHQKKDSMMDFISDDGGETYNKCHFWSNFEIADMDFWRSDAYVDYFTYLDKAGGFFYERWGDAPVHSIAAALFLSPDEIHYFDDVGYYHVPFNNCPVSEDVRLKNRCVCNPQDNFAFEGYSCTPRYYKVKNLELPEGWQKQ